MFTRSCLILLAIISLCYGESDKKPCEPDTVDFATKVDKSSIVVYGKAMSKVLYEGSDSIFYVFYQVDCVLKGPATLRQINITNAGHVEGRKYCQDFPSTMSNHRYSIAFLEPNPANKSDHGTFVPADFVEVIDEGNSTMDLLARTCNLQRLVPRSSTALVSQLCPVVSTDPSCLQTASSTVMMTTNMQVNSSNILLSQLPTNVSNKTILSADNKGLLTHPIHTPQQEIDAIRGKSSVVSVDVDKPNGAQSMAFSILLMIMAIFFSSN